MVAKDGDRGQLHDKIQTLDRIGPITDNVAQAVHLIDFLIGKIRTYSV